MHGYCLHLSIEMKNKRRTYHTVRTCTKTYPKNRRNVNRHDRSIFVVATGKR